MNYPVFIAGADNAFGNGTIAGGIGADFTLRSSDATDRTLANSISRTNASAGTIVFGSAGTGNLTIQGGFSSTNGNNNLGGIQVDNAWTQINGVVASTSTTHTLTKTGNGTLILNGNNTYTLATTISAGTLQIGASGRLGGGSYAGNLTNNAAFIYSGTNNQTLSGIISGTGALTQNNSSSTLTLSGNNTYTGATTINAGTIEIGAAGRLGGGSYSGNIANSGTLIYSGTNNQTLSGIISGIGALTQNAASTLTLSGANTYSGATTISAGTLTIGGAGQLGSGSYSGSIANSGTFIYASSANQTLSGIISGTGALTMNGASTLTLTGTSTFNGSTTISGGKLVVNGSAANSAVTIGSGATLAGSGTVGAVTVQSGGFIAPGNSPGNINVSTLTLGGGGGYTWEVANVAGTAGFDWDLITVGGGSGAATITANATNQFTIYISGNPTGWDTNNSTSWNIIDWGTVTNFDASFFSVNTTAFTGAAPVGTWAVSNTGGYLNLAYTAGDPTWNGGTGNWSTGFIPTVNGNNKNIYFVGNSTATATNNIAIGTVASVASITFNSTAGAFTLDANPGSAGYDTASALQLNGNIVNNSNATQTINLALTSNATRVYDAAAGNLAIGGAIGGVGGLTKNGSGTLTLSGNNTYAGSTTINNGTLNANSTNALGSNNTVQVNGGTLLVTADDAINGMTVTLNSTSTTVAGLAFNGTYSGLVDNLTLSKNSIIDLGDGSVSIMFDTFVMSTYTLDIYNWTGTTLWGGGTGNDTDKVYFGDDLSDAALAKIYFHSGAVGGGDSFLGSGYDLGLQQTSWDSGLEGYHIIPVPEPETYATGLLLLLGGAWWMWKRKPKAV
jgi:autotransporter-associated beta strand protein